VSALEPLWRVTGLSGAECSTLLATSAGRNALKFALTINETRVLGGLMEKAVTTPDQYPLTLNALLAACNQKSSRNPVMSLDPGEVQRTVSLLEDQHLISSKDNFNGRAQRYSQRLCNTPFAEIQFSDAEFAIITLLLLRGPQTPGELRSRGARLFSFSDNVQVVDVLAGLTQREGGPLVIQLPRKAGRQDSEYAHLLSGPIDIDVATPSPPVVTASHREDRIAALEARLGVVEKALEALQQTLAQE
jgi:uncharacterized protein YceH (UPF0502 family)